jgi:hypothetical protein
MTDERTSAIAEQGRFEQIHRALAKALRNAKASKQAHEIDLALRDSAAKLAGVPPVRSPCATNPFIIRFPSLREHRAT